MPCEIHFVIVFSETEKARASCARLSVPSSIPSGSGQAARSSTLPSTRVTVVSTGFLL